MTKTKPKKKTHPLPKRARRNPRGKNISKRVSQESLSDDELLDGEGRFMWDERRDTAVKLLALGFTGDEAAKAAGVSTRTVDRWKRVPAFLQEMDRLSLTSDTATRAERMRIVHRVTRQKLRKKNLSNMDLLKWLQYAQSETDGINLNLTALLAGYEQAELAARGPADPGKKK